jgi:anti-sigma B factor antagonist
LPFPQIFDVCRYDTGDRALLVLSGEIDLASAPLVRRWLSECLRDGVRTIDVDLGGVTFCDCAGIGVFVGAWKLATTAGGTLRLHNPSAVVARLLHLTGTGGRLLGTPSATELAVERRTPTAICSYFVVGDDHPEEFAGDPRRGGARPSHG